MKNETIFKIVWTIVSIIIIICVLYWLNKRFKEDSNYYESIVIGYHEVDIKNHFDDAEKQVKIWETLSKKYPKDEFIKEQLIVWKFNEMFYIRQIDQMFPSKEKKK